MRSSVLLGAVLMLTAAGSTVPLAAQVRPPLRTRHVILMTLDGVRGQELFGGMDSAVAALGDSNGIHDLDKLKSAYWSDTPEMRRRALMPFFWDSLVPRGILFGNRARGSVASITNSKGFSAPGYQEILTGQAQPDVTSNDLLHYDHRTVLEFVRRRLDLPRTGVAAITSWENFRGYVASDTTAIVINAGMDPLPKVMRTPKMLEYERLAHRALPVWDGTRLDTFTGATALEYLRVFNPRLLFISFDDTDDLAHSRRYDRLLDAFHGADDFLSQLWHTVQSTPGWKDQTTLILATDHGRGLGTRDWTDHGDTPGSDRIWIAVVGPDTPPVGEATDGPPVHQADIAATVLQFFGLSGRDFNPAAGPALPGTLRQAATP